VHSAFSSTPRSMQVRRDMIRVASQTAEEVREVWTNLCEAGRGSLRTTSPWREFQGKDDEYALFCAFSASAHSGSSRGGLIGYAASRPGPRRSRLASASRLGDPRRRHRSRHSQSRPHPAATIQQLFEFYGVDPCRALKERFGAKPSEKNVRGE
jgi:hypothetical protein